MFVGTKIGPYPLNLLHPAFETQFQLSSRDIMEQRHGQPARIAEMVVGRQRQSIASGMLGGQHFIFIGEHRRRL